MLHHPDAIIKNDLRKSCRNKFANILRVNLRNDTIAKKNNVSFFFNNLTNLHRCRVNDEVQIRYCRLKKRTQEVSYISVW